MKRFRGGLVFKAHRLLYHSTIGLRVIKMKKNAPKFEPRIVRVLFPWIGPLFGLSPVTCRKREFFI